MLGSHNSLSFSRPKRLISWLIAPIWRCQDLDIPAQINAGVRCFDIRCAWDRNGFVGAHGPVKFRESIYFALYDIERRCPGAYIRIILEQGENDPLICSRFRDLCNEYRSLFYNLNFFCGRTKYGWKKVADIPDGPEIIQHVGSMKSRWGRVFPRLWARLHRHDIPDSHDAIVLTDMVR